MAEELKKTPLNAVHRELGGRMVDFGGWDMPGAVHGGRHRGAYALPRESGAARLCDEIMV